MDVRELAPGLWGWTAPHPAWKPDKGWDEDVWCWYVELEGATALVDPLVPLDDAERFWRHLDADVARRALPVHILLTAAHHRRSSDEVAARYDATIWDGDGALPAGVRTFRVEHPQPVERPLWFASHRALALGDTLKIDHGELRVWWDVRWPTGREWYDERLLPSLRPLAELPVEHVLIGHGPPVVGDGAAELRAALQRPPSD
jgi:hypothetical protein